MSDDDRYVWDGCCGTCATPTWVIIPADHQAQTWKICCRNGHILVPTGTEYIVRWLQREDA